MRNAPEGRRAQHPVSDQRTPATPRGLPLPLGVAQEPATGSMPLTSDPYRVLQVRRDADWHEIRAAYRTLAWKWHPDHGGSLEQMIRINQAWRVLGHENIGERPTTRASTSKDPPARDLPQQPGPVSPGDSPRGSRSRASSNTGGMRDGPSTSSPSTTRTSSSGWSGCRLAGHWPRGFARPSIDAKCSAPTSGRNRRRAGRSSASAPRETASALRTRSAGDRAQAIRPRCSTRIFDPIPMRMSRRAPAPFPGRGAGTDVRC